MTLTVNRAEEKESNWADFLDGLRYDEFRRSVAPKRIKVEMPEAQGRADTGEADSGATKPEPR